MQSVTGHKAFATVMLYCAFIKRHCILAADNGVLFLFVGGAAAPA